MLAGLRVAYLHLSEISQTNELNIGFVLRRKYNLDNQVQILSYCFEMADYAFLKIKRVMQDTKKYFENLFKPLLEVFKALLTYMPSLAH